MPSDTFTKIDETSWGSRLLGSIAGVLIGLVLFLVAFPVLFWNEGRAVLALTLALPLALVTVGIAWLFYRPLLGVGLLAVATALFVLLKKVGTARRAPAAAD